jgi:hypothetical protein
VARRSGRQHHFPSAAIRNLIGRRAQTTPAEDRAGEREERGAHVGVALVADPEPVNATASGMPLASISR